MMYKPDLFIYLWLFPVFMVFVAPLLIVSAARLGESVLATGRSLFGTTVAPASSAILEHEQEQRTDPRQPVDGFIAHVSDGVNYCTGSVVDVSKHGICLADTGEYLDSNAEKFGVLLTGKGKSFQMQVKPRWNQQIGSKQSFGAVIEDSHWNWDEFKRHIQSDQAAAM